MFEKPGQQTTVLFLLAIAITFLAFWILSSKTGFETIGLVSNPTGTVSASVQSTVDIFLKNATVNFGAVQVGASYDTSVNYSNASQFLVRNDGSVRVNITVQSTALWTSISQTVGSSAFRWNATNATGNTSMAGACASSQNTWYTMRLSGDAAPAGTGELCYLNFSDANDYARVDIQITVPTGESAGAKTATVTFTASQA